VIHGARKEEASQDVQLAAIHALFNSLEFVRENFEREVCLIPSRLGFSFLKKKQKSGRTELYHASSM
jgi:hypothetical protein